MAADAFAFALVGVAARAFLRTAVMASVLMAPSAFASAFVGVAATAFLRTAMMARSLMAASLMAFTVVGFAAAAFLGTAMMTRALMVPGAIAAVPATCCGTCASYRKGASDCEIGPLGSGDSMHKGFRRRAFGKRSEVG